jgi:hypothetical protein
VGTRPAPCSPPPSSTSPSHTQLSPLLSFRISWCPLRRRCLPQTVVSRLNIEDGKGTGSPRRSTAGPGTNAAGHSESKDGDGSPMRRSRVRREPWLGHLHIVLRDWSTAETRSEVTEVLMGEELPQPGHPLAEGEPHTASVTVVVAVTVTVTVTCYCCCYCYCDRRRHPREMFYCACRCLCDRAVLVVMRCLCRCGYRCHLALTSVMPCVLQMQSGETPSGSKFLATSSP